MTRYVIRRPTTVGLLSRGRDYSVRDLGGSLQGYTNLLEKELGVSLAADAPQTRWTQLHELSHVRHSLWSPKLIARRMKARGIDLSPDAILAAEDARINEMLLRRVPDAHAGFAIADPRLCRKDIASYASVHASPKACADLVRPYCDRAAVARVDAFCAKVANMPDGDLTVLRVTVPLAQIIQECGGGARNDEDGGDGAEGGGDGGDGKAGQQRPAGGKQRPGGNGKAGESDEDALGEPDGGVDGCRNLPPTSNAPTPQWLVPTVHEPPLTVPMRGGNFQVTSAETGTSLRWSGLHRMGTDGVVFRRARRRPGALQKGTVLIDVSSSVSYDDDDLERVVELLPHATIAVYSGRTWGSEAAWVVVVARNGRRVASLDDRALVPRSGDNTCDGPALLWLSRQQAPRLWLCDGYTTDKSLSHTKAQEDECAAIMAAAGIVQVCGGDDVDGDGPRTLRASRTFVKGDLRRITRMPGGVAALLPAVLKNVERGRI